MWVGDGIEYNIILKLKAIVSSVVSSWFMIYKDINRGKTCMIIT